MEKRPETLAWETLLLGYKEEDLLGWEENFVKWPKKVDFSAKSQRRHMKKRGKSQPMGHTWKIKDLVTMP